MQVHRDINSLPHFKNAVVTIGTFDGMHTGHQQITRLLKEEAEKINGESVIITFHPHPRMIVENKIASSKKIILLNTLDEKIRLIENQGIGHLVIVPFTQEFSLLTAGEYIKKFLVEKFHPHTIVIGYDHRFGKQRQGNFLLLERYAQQYNYVLKEIPGYVINQMAISSTRIREAIASGDITTANEFLGYEYFFEGTVVEGDKIGRTIGYPTANILINEPDKLVPCDGIYAVEISIAGDENKEPSTYPEKKLKGMMSIGFRPTVEGTNRVIEVNIFDFNENIYGKILRIFLKKYLRQQIKFNNLQELKAQIDSDKVNALSALST